MTIYERQGMFKIVRISGFAKNVFILNERARFCCCTLVCLVVQTTGRSIHQTYLIWTSRYISFPFLFFGSTVVGNLWVLKSFIVFVFTAWSENKQIFVYSLVCFPDHRRKCCAAEPEVQFRTRSWKSASFGRQSSLARLARCEGNTTMAILLLYSTCMICR